jgi:hypothetical protein
VGDYRLYPSLLRLRKYFLSSRMYQLLLGKMIRPVEIS